MFPGLVKNICQMTGVLSADGGETKIPSSCCFFFFLIRTFYHEEEYGTMYDFIYLGIQTWCNNLYYTQLYFSTIHLKKKRLKNRENYALLAAVYPVNILQWRLRISHSEDDVSVLTPISNSIAWPSDIGAMIYI